jgi:hypothetical protein
MDRRAKKLEKKRKSREQAKKRASVLAARKPSETELLARSAAREPFGPCFISAQWNDAETPALVTVVVTRQLQSGQLVPGIALVDRTCLGVKNAHVQPPMPSRDLADLVDTLGSADGGMMRCEPLVAQSVVFHAIDYARSLGFEPHRDFSAALFGPRPSELLDTPWSAIARPIYFTGPHDDVTAITSQLAKAVGADGFDYGDAFEQSHDEDLREDDDGEIVHSPLECSVSREETTLRILIYRGRGDPGWLLEVEDQRGGSTVWEEPFESDQAAQEAALLAIEEDGIESFVVREAGAEPVPVAVSARRTAHASDNPELG